MRDEWYVARRGQDGNKRYGPVPLHQLRDLVDAGNVRPDDLVWREGMAQWQRADECEALARPAPPPRREPRDDRGGYAYDRGPRGYRDDYDDRPYRRRPYQPQSSSAWVIPLVIIGGVLAVSFLSCGGLVVAGILAGKASSTYSPGYTNPVSEPDDAPAFQDPPPWQNQGLVPDPNPPGFVPPNPNPPIFPPPPPP
jgi:hypothetical protein